MQFVFWADDQEKTIEGEWDFIKQVFVKDDRERVKKEEKYQYCFDHTLCGTPVEWREKILTEDNYEIRFCRACFEARKKTKACLKCGQKFNPTCNIQHTCKDCYTINQYKKEDGIW